MQGCLRFFSLLLLLTACSSIPVAGRTPSSSGPIEHAFSRLREKGASDTYLRMLQDNYREDERMRVLDLNLLGFLKMRPEQIETIPGWELQKIERFIKKNQKPFAEVEKKFAVPKEVIASLLWVETRHGKDIGRFHVASAFLSIAQADYPTILDQTMDLARSRVNTLTPEIEARVIERSKRKSDWAVDELMALEEVHNKNYKRVEKLEGSFSGAFGMAQFLPSSYLAWAKGRKRQPNLFKADDSIYSVANYLTVNGWKKKDRESHEAALFHYNRDRNYVNRILKMSECLKSPAKRKLWKGKKRRVASLGSC